MNWKDTVKKTSEHSENIDARRKAGGSMSREEAKSIIFDGREHYNLNEKTPFEIVDGVDYLDYENIREILHKSYLYFADKFEAYPVVGFSFPNNRFYKITQAIEKAIQETLFEYRDEMKEAGRKKS